MQTRQLVLEDQEVHADDLLLAIDNDPQLVLVFADVAFFESGRLPEVLAEAFPAASLVGCSTAGEISGGGVDNDSCVLTGIRFHQVCHVVAEAGVADLESSYQAGLALGDDLPAQGLQAVLLFGRGVDINGSALIDGLVSRIGKRIPITGGLAGDGGAFTRTWVLGPAGPRTDGVVAVGLYGDALRLGYGSYGGWQPYGPARKVTRCEGNVLYELDGEPALNIYKKYLGPHASGLPATGLLFPFEMLGRDRGDLGLIRTILGVDEEAGSLVLAGDIDPQGYLRLMHATTDGLTDGAARAAEMAVGDGPADFALALLVSCVGRKLVMGDLAEDEVEAVVDTLGGAAAVTGFYSYGEISPFSNTTDCKLHNQTMTVTFIGERD